MIEDLDQSIRQLMIKKGGFDPAEVDIGFEAPDREWAASKSKPTVNAYLYDMRENHELRSYEWNVERANGTATRKKAPLRLDLSYLFTCWTKDIEDEHRLLERLLVTLVRHPVFPEEVLLGTLKGLEYPIHTTAAQPDGLFKNPADFWSSLDNRLRPSINYVVTLPVDLEVAFTAPLVTTKIIDIKQQGAGEAEESFQIGGSLHRKGKTAVISGVGVTVKETGMATQTDGNGRYSFARLRKGNYTLQISVPGKVAKEIQIEIPGQSYDIEI